MKYKDYYQALGVERNASTADIKKAYRKLAHMYHPDISKDPKGEEKFKEVAEAYATLKDEEKRKEYDDLGRRPAGQEFSAPPSWQQEFGAGAAAFDDVDLADILKSFRPGARGASRQQSRASMQVAGDDFSVSVDISLEKVYSGGETDVSVELPEYDAHGLPHRVSTRRRRPHSRRAVTPPAASSAGPAAPTHR